MSWRVVTLSERLSFCRFYFSATLSIIWLLTSAYIPNHTFFYRTRWTNDQRSAYGPPHGSCRRSGSTRSDERWWWDWPRQRHQSKVLAILQRSYVFLFLCFFIFRRRSDKLSCSVVLGMERSPKTNTRSWSRTLCDLLVNARIQRSVQYALHLKSTSFIMTP